jgi:hypothetical protein
VIAVFVGHVLTAVITTAIFEEGFSVFRASTIRGLLHKEYTLSVTIAFVLGYFVYYKWHSAPGKWIWIAGVLCFAEGALAAWHVPHSVLTGRPSLGAVCSEMFFPVYGGRPPLYALMLVRTMFYSIGAWVCWYGEEYGWSAVLHYVKACLNALRGGGATET